jgi:hypothetical protein
MTAMAIKRRTKRHTKCCIDLDNLHTMPTATIYPIKPHCTTYADSNALSVDLFPKFNAANATLARDHSPA